MVNLRPLRYGPEASKPDDVRILHLSAPCACWVKNSAYPLSMAGTANLLCVLPAVCDVSKAWVLHRSETLQHGMLSRRYWA